MEHKLIEKSGEWVVDPDCAVGILEAFAASYLSLLTGGAFGAEYKDILAFSILILILIFRPKGLLGEVVRERA